MTGLGRPAIIVTSILTKSRANDQIDRRNRKSNVGWLQCFVMFGFVDNVKLSYRSRLCIPSYFLLTTARASVSLEIRAERPFEPREKGRRDRSSPYRRTYARVVIGCIGESSRYRCGSYASVVAWRCICPYRQNLLLLGSSSKVVLLT